jgi:hypothetical protein
MVKKEAFSYLHLSHTRTNQNPFLDSKVEIIDFSKFEILLLGGDLAFLTSQNEATMNYVDAVYDLSNENTLWSLGNHDTNSVALVESYTNRMSYYAYSKNKICFLVLNTQDSLSNIVGDQLDFFNNVMDTIQESSHLIILTHKLIWMYSHPILQSQIDSISNGQYGSCSYCVNPNNFYDDIYPRLIEAKVGGIEVLCIAGDIGIKTKEFSFITDENITFLASGIWYNDDGNKALILNHNLVKKELYWEFMLIDNLPIH